MTEDVQDCRSEDGVTVGLVDAVISILRVLAPRDLSTTHAQEALEDLTQDPDLRTVLAARQPPTDAPNLVHSMPTSQVSEPREVDEPCFQHPNAPVIGGVCGGCTQYPADMAKGQQP